MTIAFRWCDDGLFTVRINRRNNHRDWLFTVCIVDNKICTEITKNRSKQSTHITLYIRCIRRDTGDYFYVVERGDFDIYVNGQKVVSFTRGNSFGELALLYNCPRAATCQSRNASEVWSLDRTKSVEVSSSLVVAEGINTEPKKCNCVSSCLVSPLLVEDVFDIVVKFLL